MRASTWPGALALAHTARRTAGCAIQLLCRCGRAAQVPKLHYGTVL